MQKFFVLLLICTGIFTHAFVKTRHNRISRAVFQAQAEDVEELDIGDFENVEFKKVQTVNDAIAKYSIKAYELLWHCVTFCKIKISFQF